MRKNITAITFAIIFLFIFILFFNNGNKKNKSPISSAPKLSYIALGDSVSAGVGLETFSDSSACNRTNRSYPNLVASKLNLSASNISCSGATISTGILGSQNVNNLIVSPQINQLSSKPKPNLITLTIGANDIQWTDIISKCYISQCGTSDDTAGVDARLSTLDGSLTDVLTQIKSIYKSNTPNVVVTGYHQVFPADGVSCSDLSGIDASELAWGRQQQTNLNKHIQAVVANFSFAKFAAIDFSGHELCTTDSWVQGLNDSAPYHPNQAGQQEYASQVEAAYREFK